MARSPSARAQWSTDTRTRKVSSGAKPLCAVLKIYAVKKTRRLCAPSNPSACHTSTQVTNTLDSVSSTTVLSRRSNVPRKARRSSRITLFFVLTLTAYRRASLRSHAQLVHDHQAHFGRSVHAGRSLTCEGKLYQAWRHQGAPREREGRLRKTSLRTVGSTSRVRASTAGSV